MRLQRCLFAFALSVPCALSAQTTIHIPADKPTIQAGIDAAANGDAVLVSPGTYYENIDFKGKAITVTSSGGAAVTTIDGGGVGTAVTFKTKETRSSILSNLTITHGGVKSGNGNQNYANGPGISIQASRPTILNNVITQNYCQNIDLAGAPLLQGNTISYSLTPQYCTVLATGGIRVDGDYTDATGTSTGALITGNTIEHNTTGQSGDGGGDGGGGIAVWGGSPVILGNTIRYNTTISGNGGGINLVFASNVEVLQNLIYGNQAGCGGGAIAGFSSSQYYVANNIMVDNTVYPNGGGYSNCAKTAELFGIVTAKYVNNIIVGNTSYPQIECGDLYVNSIPAEYVQPVFDHNLFRNEGGPVLGASCVDVTAKYGNLVGDPKFLSAATNDFHLTTSSPAVDAGNGSVLGILKAVNGLVLSTDIEGHPREQDATGKGYPVIDMGAYELSGAPLSAIAPTRIVVSPSGTYLDAGSTLGLTATFSSALGVPTGTATFLMDGQAAGSDTIVAGVAKLNVPSMRPGDHSIVVTYPGQGPFAAAVSVVLIVRVNVYGTRLSISGNPNPSLLGQTVNITVISSSADASYIPSPIRLMDNPLGGNVYATLTPDATGVAHFAISSLPLGYTYLYVSYAGDTVHGGAYSGYAQQVVQGYPVTVSLSSSANPSSAGQAVTFAARVVAQNSVNGTPAGSVQFTDGSTVLGSSTLDASGSASVSVSTLSTGSHTITATYVASNTFAGGSATLQQVVHGSTPLIGFSVLPVNAAYGVSRAALASVTAPSAGMPAPTGFVTFCSVPVGGSTTCTGSNVGRIAVSSSGSATVTITPNAGTTAYGCTYSGDSVYDAGDCTPVVTTTAMAASALMLSVSPNPSPALTPVGLTGRVTYNGVPAASASVSLSIDGGAAMSVMTDASGNFSASSSLGAGSHTVVARSLPDGNHTAASASVVETVTANPTATTLTVSPPMGVQGVAVTFNVTVTALAGTASPYGTIAVFDGPALLGQTLVAAPVLGKTVTAVTLTATFSTPGDRALTAVYTPADGNFVGSGSAGVTVPVSARNFTVTLDPASMTVQTEHHKTLTVTLTSIGGLTGRIGLACGALPDAASCTWAQNAVVLPANGTVSTQVTLDTDRVLGFKSSVETRPVGVGLALAGASPLALLLLRRRRGAMWLPVLLLAAGCALLAGCSGQYPAHTQPGTYTVPIVATSGDAAAPSRTAPLVLTVTQ